jgi:hypothetical protein
MAQPYGSDGMTLEQTVIASSKLRHNPLQIPFLCAESLLSV